MTQAAEHPGEEGQPEDDLGQERKIAALHATGGPGKRDEQMKTHRHNQAEYGGYGVEGWEWILVILGVFAGSSLVRGSTYGWRDSRARAY